MAKKDKLPVKSSAMLPRVDYAEATKSSKEHEARERRWKAEEALRDIERAEGHKNDKGLMKDVKTLCAEKIKNLGKIK